ncbi:hypothetical protein ROJ8625_00229 [Roseivivax jejudonensis]|uniref:Phosphotriesterase homology protein n=1 Tax=Roseivivax jejudonensis TaxID=1529041 RepID=A0A1X6Y577_9RHOB|nr:phosphotriesterase [Roseivivax jejudonensis]SLN10935.1 hypothetical protein ROJ8625_00229 [Roseivivax jejudonensis]
MAELSPAHVGSGFVMTVDGPRPSAEMGVTLMHEHLQNDCSCWWHPPETEERQYLVDGPVRIEILSELRQDPFVNRHNIALDELDLAIDELGDFVRLGGQTVVDPTCRGIGRDPNKLRQISARTGLQIVMGAGYYLASSMPEGIADKTADDIADEIVTEALTGVDGTDARIGLIGEIGVSGDFLEIEERSLRGAARAQARTGLPLMVHLPGWFRHAHKVLDIVESESADIRQTVLCHMNPSFDDVAYQTELADRGAFLEFDMIGMDFYYADQGVQCPSDDQVAEAIIGLAGAGHLDRLLLSQDVFIKMMLTRYGGNGYAFVLRHFLPRLERHGMPRADAMRMLTHNARSVFDSTIS